MNVNLINTSKGDFEYVIVPFDLYDECRDTLSSCEKDINVVLMTGHNDAVYDRGLISLPMPVYADSIANALNGKSGSFAYSENSVFTVRFAAPGAKVLVVDDIRTNLMVAQGLMQPYRMHVDVCESGAEAIELIQTKDYDLVFMDHRMPEMDGVETTKRIREMDDPYYKNVPIIALTADAMADTKEMMLTNGFSAFLSKPIDTARLNMLLEKWIPSAKQSGSAADDASHGVDESEVTIEIKGVDTRKGIRMTGGKAEFYIETLETFHGDGAEYVEALRESVKMGDWMRYSIRVHALKSAAANIGANDLSEAAKALELAVDREDFAFIHEHAEAFTSRLESLLHNMDESIKSYRAAVSRPSVDANSLKDELSELKTALEELDIGAINERIDQLLTYAHDDEAVVRKISNHILLSEYNEAVELIDTLLD